MLIYSTYNTISVSVIIPAWLLWIIYVISVLFLLCFCVHLLIDALWSPAGKGLTSDKLQHLLCFFWFSVTKQSLEMVLASPNDQEYPRYPLVLKFNVTLAQPLCFVILYFFTWKLLLDDRHL